MNLKNFIQKSFKVILWLSLFVGVIIVRVEWNDLQKSVKVPVSLGSKFIFTESWDKGYFSGRGTWQVAGDTQDNKLNMVEITCLRNEKTCALSVASVNNFGFGRPLLATSLDILDVERWDSQVIIFKELKTCAETTYSVTRDTKSVMGLRKLNTNREGCSSDNRKEVGFNLVNGLDVFIGLIHDKEDVPLNIFIAIITFLISAAGIYRVFKPRS